MNGTGMRLSDWFTFHRAAQTFGQWILVRWTNPESLKYIGRRTWDPGHDRILAYYPKPIDCKPKTADIDIGGYELAGLVIDPTVHKAFGKDSKVAAAAHAWQKFLHGLGVNDAVELNRQTLSSRNTPLTLPNLAQVMHASATRGGVSQDRLRQVNARQDDFSQERGFRVDLDLTSRHYGCLLFNGMYLHGDYDLKDIIDPRQLGPNMAVAERLHGQPHMRSAELDAVQQFVNAAIGVPMVQHGGEAQYTGHSEDQIEVFGPHGEAHTLDGRDEILRWYKFGWNRQTIDPKTSGGGSSFAPPSRVQVPMSKGGLVLIGADVRDS
jgi:hypothetical protein